MRVTVDAGSKFVHPPVLYMVMLAAGISGTGGSFNRSGRASRESGPPRMGGCVSPSRGVSWRNPSRYRGPIHA